jgi:hypothetical protein
MITIACYERKELALEPPPIADAYAEYSRRRAASAGASSAVAAH